MADKDISREDKDYSPEYWVNYLLNRFKETKDWRATRIERQWMVNHAYYRGWQELKYDRRTGRLVWDEKNPLQFYINKIYSIVRAVIAHTTKDQPQWEVTSRPYGELDDSAQRKLSYFLEGEFERMNMKMKLKNMIKYGLLYGMGIIEYGYDADLDGGNLWSRVWDPFDVYIDPKTTQSDLSDCRFIIKAVVKPVEFIKNDTKYNDNREDIQPESKSAASDWKQYLISQQHGTDPTAFSMDDSAILYEGFCRFTDKKTGEDKIRLIAVCNKMLLRNEVLDTDEFPFVIYQPDINPGEIYGEGWVKHLVPLNKALNYLEKAILEYNVMFSKGKYITDKGSNVKMITNENGQIVRVSRGSRFEQMDIKPMSNTPFNQISSITEYMAEIGAAHEAFMGERPGQVTAARAIESLVASNMNNLADLIDNLEDTLQTLGKRFLELGYEHFVDSKEFMVRTSGARHITGKVISGKYIAAEDVVPIPEKNDVRVKVISGLAHTKEAQRELMLMLRQQNDVDRRTLLETFHMNADEVELRLKEENELGIISSDAEVAAAQDPTLQEQPMAPEGMPVDPLMPEELPVDPSVPEGA